ncbi:hypothetical protein TNCV_657231 [Trichonephila clavipes]|nr:hypothetical protein TNCV_657231 [Trichonephila clavipes]
MFRLGNTRPLPGHSSIGSISTRKNLHPGVTPPTTKSNKGGSVPVIWQNQARRLPEVHLEYNATASGRGSNGCIRMFTIDSLWTDADKFSVETEKLGGRTGKILRPSSVALKSKNQEINRLQLAVKLPWAIFFESVDILS